MSARDNLKMRRAGLVGVSALCVVFFSTSDSATKYYVDNSSAAASDSNAGTSPNLPWATLKKVSSTHFSPGDVILLKAGTINAGGLQTTLVGTATAPIVIGGYGTGSKPVVKNSTVYGSYSDAIELDNSRYVIIDGLALTSAADAGVDLWQSNNIIVRNNEMYGVGAGVQIAGN